MPSAQRPKRAKHRAPEPCPTTGKHRFRTHDAAQRELDKAQQSYDLGMTNRREIRTYQCPFCHYHHLTSTPHRTTTLESR